MPLKTVRFELWDTTAFTGEKYQCDTPGDQSGKYVETEIAERMLDALKIARNTLSNVSYPYGNPNNIQDAMFLETAINKTLGIVESVIDATEAK